MFASLNPSLAFELVSNNHHKIVKFSKEYIEDGVQLPKSSWLRNYLKQGLIKIVFSISVLLSKKQNKRKLKVFFQKLSVKNSKLPS